MKTLAKLIEIIKSNSRKDVGNVQTNSKGVKYQYVTYHLNTPFHWVIKMFEQSQIEIYGDRKKVKDYKRLSHENINIHCEYSNFVGQKPRSISMNELIILD